MIFNDPPTSLLPGKYIWRRNGGVITPSITAEMIITMNHDDEATNINYAGQSNEFIMDMRGEWRDVFY